MLVTNQSEIYRSSIRKATALPHDWVILSNSAVQFGVDDVEVQPITEVSKATLSDQKGHASLVERP